LGGLRGVVNDFPIFDCFHYTYISSQEKYSWVKGGQNPENQDFLNLFMYGYFLPCEVNWIWNNADKK